MVDAKGQPDVDKKGTDLASTSSPRLRQYFPETLLWRPELITDDRGNASLDLPLADSITTWRLSASAVSAQGQLGSTQSPIRVFQNFFADLNLPATLTRGDEISVPAIIYNYLDTPQTVSLALTRQDWFELLDPDTRQIPLAPGQVASVYFRIRTVKAGAFTLKLSARAGDTADALQRPIEILPDGQLVETTSSGTLSADPLAVPLNIPANAIDGSLHAQVKIYPSTFSQLVEGLDSIFQMPYGCFEQTSSTTYPNVLALDYLHTTKTTALKTEATAHQYIHLGYQRLLAFEIPGGGFDWFGHPPADRTLTAYGLMEFQDMARVHSIDPALITRTRSWLLAQRQSDGSWEPGRRFYHDDPTALGDARVATTAYIAWSVFAAQAGAGGAGSMPDPAAVPTQRFLHNRAQNAKSNPYTAALTAIALLTIDPQDATARDLVALLESTRQDSPDRKLTHWSPTAKFPTNFYGAGASADVETTALAALALIKASGHAPATNAALQWLVAAKDPRGTWHSTQATVLALKALLAGTTAVGTNEERRLALQLPDQALQEIRIAPDQSEVLSAFDLTPRLQPGAQTLRLLPRNGPEVAYQVTLRYNIPSLTPPPVAPRSSLTIALTYNRSRLAVGDTLPVTATLRNSSTEPLAMVLADLPIPPGFTAGTASLDTLQSHGQIEKYQVTSRQILVYLRGVDPATTLSLPYSLHATIPLKIQSPPATAYEYYNPENRTTTTPTSLEVTGD